MKRKSFLRALTILPLANIAIRSFGKVNIPFITEQCKTQRDVEGPYYKLNAPVRTVIETTGSPLQITGKVLDSKDCQTPIAQATVDVWHCDDHGDYDMSGFKCRAQVKTDAKGRYSFTTIFPPAYGGRPRHIHFKIRATGFAELTTQLYFQGDPAIKNDFARNARNERIISLTTDKELRKGLFDIYL
jgi:catechol 1,2-dioxygenase